MCELYYLENMYIVNFVHVKATSEKSRLRKSNGSIVIWFHIGTVLFRTEYCIGV